MTDTVPTARHDEMRRMLMEEIAVRDRVIDALAEECLAARSYPILADNSPKFVRLFDARKASDSISALSPNYGCSAFTCYTIASAPDAIRNGYAICVNADPFDGSIECVVTFRNADAKEGTE